MKQKIVISVSLNDQKARSKALKIAVGVYGTQSAGLGGDDKSQIEVVGDGVDPVVLATLLRKKVGYAEIVSVSAVEEKKEEKKEEAKEVQHMVWSYGNVGVPQVIAVQDPYHPDPYSCSIL